MQMENLVYAIILLPLFGFVINGLFGKFLPKMVVGALATLVVFASFLISVNIFLGFTDHSAPIIVKALNGLQWAEFR
jgi:NADH-quinone oxidoreductase subunit L